MITSPAAILFDLDDTIVAWDVISPQIWRDTCLKFTSQLNLNTDKLVEEISHCRRWYLNDLKRHEFARLNLPDYRKEIVTMAFARLGLEANGMVETIARTYGEKRENAAHLLPGTIETLEYFKRKGIPLALVSNGMSDRQWYKIKRFNLEKYFKCIVIEGDFGTGKPDSRVFQHALDELQVTASDAWMVGDNLYFDVGGGKAAGLYTVWVDWEGSESFATAYRPDRMVKSIAGLMNQE